MDKVWVVMGENTKECNTFLEAVFKTKKDAEEFCEKRSTFEQFYFCYEEEVRGT